MRRFCLGILSWLFFAFGLYSQTAEFRDEPLYTDLKIAMEHPERVKRLALNRKKYKRIPKDVFNFPNLWELDLSKNKLSTLPPEISKLKKLRVLNLERNALESLPKELCDLSKLEVLNLRKNELYQLPDCLTELSRLNYLIVSSNPIFKLPKSINGMVQLTEFDARSTDIHSDAIKSMQQALPGSRILWDSDCNCGPNH